MDSKVRKLLFKPLSEGGMSAMVPDFRIELQNGKKVRVPALLTTDGKQFLFALHFTKSTPPERLGHLEKKVVTLADQIVITGQINGEIAFRSLVFPPGGYTSRSRGTSTLSLHADRMELIAEGTEKWSNRRMRKALGMPPKLDRNERTSFFAHVIFHGPKLRIRDAGSKTTSVNDFLGDAVSSSFDTHVFADTGYEGALIQKDDELHLHLRSKEGNERIVDPKDLLDRVASSVAFAFGFHPRPAYRELKVDHRVVERWISPKFDLKQTFLAPVSDSLWSTFRADKDSAVHTIIPTVAAGLQALATSERERIDTLLWHVRSSALSGLPDSTKLLILSAALDGLMKVIAGVPEASQREKTDRVWRRASDLVRLSWEDWSEGIFALWGRYRHNLSHGRLWIPEEAEGNDDVLHYAELGCAFMTIIAARCGYTGPIMANPFELRAIDISKKRATG